MAIQTAGGGPTPSSSVADPTLAADPTLHLPRLLCLHGGGVTGDVFRAQARSLTRQLSPYFRLVFADGPFLCDPGPGILPVYADWGPFRRWLRWLPAHDEIDKESAVEEIGFALRTAMERDDGRGEWVGLVGFSQGAKLAASLLFEAQARAEAEEQHAEEEEGGLDWLPRWKFAVLLAGRHPLVSLSPRTAHPALVSAAAISEGFDYPGEVEDKLRLPTVHVHGLQDPGLHLHRRLLRQYCDKDTVTVVEWEGSHRVPIKMNDIVPIVDATLDAAVRAGVYSRRP
ncbi:citrinin biosynthesis oxidoreductase CtnB [Lineolata rhizophorae]|uniref:Citrinin biosynthesis oxidoreductase CtnB n=1 Tax=Lineolata rhizophorae TaxID=578093 RepID=A0A6A6P8U4_9PEZI|nr:citrinin biosynthesis oxidoreductase CtnB [Lineolata rhizophorae]